MQRANIDRIHAHLHGVLGVELMDAKTRDAVERCLERISEAVRKLGPAIEARHSGIPWRSIRGLGNVLRHDRDYRDPFDRLLVAQSATEPMILLTADRRLARYGTTIRVV